MPACVENSADNSALRTSNVHDCLEQQNGECHSGPPELAVTVDTSSTGSIYEELGIESDELPYPEFADLAFGLLSQETHPRDWCLAIVTNPWIERVSLVVILLNCITLGLYTCSDAACETTRCQVLSAFDHAIFAYFLIEMLIKILAMGFVGPLAYLTDNWNRLDFAIVIAGLGEYIASMFADMGGINLTAIRTIRVLRPLRAINRIPSLRILVTLLLDTLPMLGNVLMLCFFVFFIFGIMGVQLWAGMMRTRCAIAANVSRPVNFSDIFIKDDGDDFLCSLGDGMQKCTDIPHYVNPFTKEHCELHPEQSNDYFDGFPSSFNSSSLSLFDENQTKCINWNYLYSECVSTERNPHPISFDNIGSAWITIFQIISLESWVEIMYDLQDAFSYWSWIYFVALIVIGTYFMLNLCLVVIATQFSDTKRQELTRIRQERMRNSLSFTSIETANVYKQIIKLIALGIVAAKTYIIRQYRIRCKNEQVQLEVERPRERLENHALFDLLRSQRLFTAPVRVPQHEGAEQGVLETDRDGNKRPSLSVPIDCCKRTSKHMRVIVMHPYTRRSIMICILVNSIMMAIEHHNQPELLTITFDYANMFFTFLFTVEMVAKVMAFGIIGYVESFFNLFDGLIVIISLAEIVSGGGGSSLAVLRTFRLLRILKLVQFLPALRKQFSVLLRTIDNVAIFFILLLIFVFIFSILGMNLFGCKFCSVKNGIKRCDRKNFDSLLWAMVTVFQVLTQEDWNLVLYMSMEYTNVWASLYFVALMTFGNYVLFNLLVAILVEGFSSERAKSRNSSHKSYASVPMRADASANIADCAVAVVDAEDDASEQETDDEDADEPQEVQSPRKNTLPIPKSPPPRIIRTAATPHIASRECLTILNENEELNMSPPHRNVIITNGMNRSSVPRHSLTTSEDSILEMLQRLANRSSLQRASVHDNFSPLRKPVAPTSPNHNQSSRSPSNGYLRTQTGSYLSRRESVLSNGTVRSKSLSPNRNSVLSTPTSHTYANIGTATNSNVSTTPASPRANAHRLGEPIREPIYANLGTPARSTETQRLSHDNLLRMLRRVNKQKAYNPEEVDSVADAIDARSINKIDWCEASLFIPENQRTSLKADCSAASTNQTNSDSKTDDDEEESDCDLPSTPTRRHNAPIIQIRPPTAVAPDITVESSDSGSSPAAANHIDTAGNSSDNVSNSPFRAPMSRQNRSQSLIPPQNPLGVMFNAMHRFPIGSPFAQRKYSQGQSPQSSNSARRPSVSPNSQSSINSPNRLANSINSHNSSKSPRDDGDVQVATVDLRALQKLSKFITYNDARFAEQDESDASVRSRASSRLSSARSNALSEQHDTFQSSAVSPSNSHEDLANVEKQNCGELRVSRPEHSKVAKWRRYLPEMPAFLRKRYEHSLFIFSEQNAFRRGCSLVCDSKHFDYVILAFILLNCVEIGLENPKIPPDSVLRRVLTVSNFVTTTVFTVELLIKVTSKGLLIGSQPYLSSGWNQLDFVLMVTSVVDILISVTTGGSKRFLSVLRVFRLLRALRPLRLISRAPGLKLVVQTLLSSIKPIGNIVLICGTFLAIFGILGVQLFKGKFYHCEGLDVELVRTKNDCLSVPDNKWVNHKYNFDNLMQALVTLFVLASRDGWVQIMYQGLDAVGEDVQPIENYAEVRIVYFISYILLVGFVVLQMFVGVVVDNFEQHARKQEQQRRKKFLESRITAIEERLDSLGGPAYWESLPTWRRCVHTLVMNKYFDIVVALMIVLNIVSMSVEHYMMPQILELSLNILNYVFTAFFVVEAVLRIVALGVRRYLSEAWNRLDVAIVILSLGGIVLDNVDNNFFHINPTIVRVFRVLRLSRLIKLLKMTRGSRALLDTVAQALPQVGNLGLLFLLMFFIYAALGVECFGRIECTHDNPCTGFSTHANFETFGGAFLTLFRISTGDNWNSIMKDTLRDTCDPSEECTRNCCVASWTPSLYFVSFVLIAQFVMVNVVIAVLMRHLQDASKDLKEEKYLIEDITDINLLNAALEKVKQDLLKATTEIAKQNAIAMRVE